MIYNCFLRTLLVTKLLSSDINECDANPCHNGGTCNNTVGSFICACAIGYDGDTCQNGNDF